MRVLELTLRNYRVFEEVDLELPSRVIGVFGPNGAGKSTLMEAMLYALYGRARTAKNEIRTQGILTDCLVRLAFEHGGNQYEVRRTIRGKNHTTDAGLYAGGLQLAAGVTEVDGEIQKLLRMDQQVFRASVFAEQKQLDAFSDVTKGKRKEMVLRLLGIRPVDEARAVAKREARRAKETASRLAEALPPIAELEAEVELARQRAHEAKEAASAAAEALEEARKASGAANEAFEEADAVRERIEQIAIARRAAGEEAERMTLRRDDLQGRIERLRAELGEIPSVEKELASLAGARERLEAARRLIEVTGEFAEREAVAAGLPKLDVEAALKELEEVDRSLRAAEKASAGAESARDGCRTQLGEARKRLDVASEADPTQPCPTCGRELGAGFEAYVSHCRDEVAAAERSLAEAEDALTAVAAATKKAAARLQETTARGEEARRAADDRGRLDEEISDLRARMAALAEPFGGETPDAGALEAATRRAEELGKRLAELASERKRLSEMEADAAALQDDLDSCILRIEQIDREAAGLAFEPEEHARLKKARDEAARILEEVRGAERAAAERSGEEQKALGRLEGELSQTKKISAEAESLREEARHVERVSILLDGFRDHLVARVGPELSREAEALFRELTNNEYDDLKIDESTLAIRIADGKDYFPIERFSGSETDLANLALRVAISMHLSRMSGADIGMLVLDEVLGALDAERKDLMVQTMGKLSGRFHQLFVVTHAEQVKDQFPASIEVRKAGHRRSVAALA